MSETFAGVRDADCKIKGGTTSMLWMVSWQKSRLFREFCSDSTIQFLVWSQRSKIKKEYVISSRTTFLVLHVSRAPRFLFFVDRFRYVTVRASFDTFEESEMQITNNVDVGEPHQVIRLP